MLFDNANPFCKSKRPEDILASYWYNKLWDKVISMYKWEGAEIDNGDINPDYLEWALMSEGWACFVKDSNGKVRGLRCTRTGYDIYNQPTAITVNNAALKAPIHATVGVNGVLIKNNKFAIPIYETIKYYARQLAKIQTSMNVGLSNSRLTKVFVANGDPQAQQIRKMVDDADAGKLGTIIKKNIADSILEEGNIPVYATASDYLTDKYLQDMRTVLNDFFIHFGINESAANLTKGERNLTAEVHANDQEILVNRAYFLESREKAAEECNKIFGTSISVKIRGEEAVENVLSQFGNEPSGTNAEPQV